MKQAGTSIILWNICVLFRNLTSEKQAYGLNHGVGTINGILSLIFDRNAFLHKLLRLSMKKRIAWDTLSLWHEQQHCTRSNDEFSWLVYREKK